MRENEQEDLPVSGNKLPLGLGTTYSRHLMSFTALMIYALMLVGLRFSSVLFPAFTLTFPCFMTLQKSSGLSILHKYLTEFTFYPSLTHQCTALIVPISEISLYNSLNHIIIQALQQCCIIFQSYDPGPPMLSISELQNVTNFWIDTKNHFKYFIT